MPTVLNVNDIIEARIITKLGNQAGVNVRHYVLKTLNNTHPTDQQFADALSLKMAPFYKAMMANAASFLGVVARRIQPFPPTPPVVSQSGTGVGAAGPTPAPTQVSGIITLRTANAGKSFRGRVYVPFPTTSSVDSNGAPNAGYLTALQQLAVGLSDAVTITIAAGETPQFVPMVYSRKREEMHQVLSAEGQDRWATQRRRGMYGAPNLFPLP